jgi:CelD/BcsL family acetyltransferase involved in cellulose biosynthesis
LLRLGRPPCYNPWDVNPARTCPGVSSPTLTVTRHERFLSIQSGWNKLLRGFAADTIFLTPSWQQIWWRTNGEGELHLLTVREGAEIVGVAPLARVGDTWGFAGGVEVADFLDVLARPGSENAVAGAVLDYVEAHGGRVSLRNLRPDSFVATCLCPLAQRRGFEPRLDQEDVSPRVNLPASWEDYLQSLTKKDRHELRRKLRRLLASGAVSHYAVAAPLARDVDDFLRLHRLSGENKAAFMTAAMEWFFRALVEEFAASGLLRMYFLEIAGIRVASVILFDYGGEFLLYNSGFDPAYSPLSVGLLLKAFCIRDAIEAGRRVFDFLQGDEPYKYDLGAHDVPILELRFNVGRGNEVLRASLDV